MRRTIDTHTGKIVIDVDLLLEYLYVGDYGKENNIKASFLGYNKRIDKVEHRDVDISDKLVVTVSSQKGCPMKCNFCDCPKLVSVLPGTRRQGRRTAGHKCWQCLSLYSLSATRHGRSK